MIARLAVALAVISTLGACASITQDKTQPVKVETLDQAGNKVVGAKCDLQNDRGSFNVETPHTVFVRKSGGALVITCKAPDQPQADGKLISRVGGALFGNILFGGGIGAIIDTASGVAYNYPEWVQLVFGKTLTFDRKDFKTAQPTVAITEPVSKDAKTAEAQTPGAAPVATEPQKVEHINLSSAGASNVK